MQKNIADFEQELAQRAVQADKDRRAAVEVHQKEQAEREAELKKEIEKRNAKNKETELLWEARKREKAVAEEQRKKKEHEERIQLELIQNEESARLAKEQEELERIAKDLLQVQWLEEQHQKSLENSKVPQHQFDDAEEADNRHILSGEAAAGTDGLEVGPNMSTHLRSILRQI